MAEDDNNNNSNLLILLCSVHPSRLAAASVTVLLTTLEDGVWLVPLVLHASSRTIAVVHALTFVTTFTLLSLSIGLATVLILQQATASGGKTNLERHQQDGALFSAVGATLCWLIAAVLYYKAWSRRRRRERQQAEQRRLSDAVTAAMFEPVDDMTPARSKYDEVVEYGSVPSGGNDEDENDNNETPAASAAEDENHHLQIWLVVSLTIVGALDEISYFPGLVVGKVFSVAELTLGTAIASLLILLIVCVALAPCRPVLEFLDRIPLFMVVALFATILTISAVWEYTHG